MKRIGTFILVLLLVATSGAMLPWQAGTVQATVTSTVSPILECVEDNGNGTFTAHFGYKNVSGSTISIPVGNSNKFTPAPADRGQPVAFSAGRTPYWPDAAFSVVFNEGETLVWTLNGKTSTAGAGSQRCAYHVFLEKTWQDEDGNSLESPPAGLLGDFKMTATSSLGRAECSYPEDSTELVCTYWKGAVQVQDGLWVPPGTSYTVEEEGLPEPRQVALSALEQVQPSVSTADGCDPYSDLSMSLISDSEATVTNASSTCSYEVGLASYQRYDNIIDHQGIYDWDATVIEPGQSINLKVNLPSGWSQQAAGIGEFQVSPYGEGYCTPGRNGIKKYCTHTVENQEDTACAAQIDLFHGPVLSSLDGERYGSRLHDWRWIEGDNFCATPPGFCPTGELTFAVTSGDLSAPTVVEDGDTVSGKLYVKIDVAYEDQPQKVVFTLNGPDGLVLEHTERWAPFYFLGDDWIDGQSVPRGWNSDDYPEGDYTITAVPKNARDEVCDQGVVFHFTVKREGPRVQIEKVWRDASGNVIDPPASILSDFKIVAQSSVGTAECVYPEGSTELECTYTLDGQVVDDGLVVPEGETYAVTETGLPAPRTTTTSLATVAEEDSGCEKPRPYDDLVFTLLTDNTGTVTNNSTTCSYQVGLASYQMYDHVVDHQTIYDWDSQTVEPGQTVNLSVLLPSGWVATEGTGDDFVVGEDCTLVDKVCTHTVENTQDTACAAQVDMFFGSVLMSLNGERYGTRLRASKLVAQDDFCPIPAGFCPGVITGLEGIEDGQVVADGSLYIRAMHPQGYDQPQWVFFTLNGPDGVHIEQMERWAPYYFMGDSQVQQENGSWLTVPKGWNSNNYAEGTYTLQAAPSNSLGEICNDGITTTFTISRQGLVDPGDGTDDGDTGSGDDDSLTLPDSNNDGSTGDGSTIGDGSDDGSVPGSGDDTDEEEDPTKGGNDNNQQNSDTIIYLPVTIRM